jgi:hypothetical protein
MRVHIRTLPGPSLGHESAPFDNVVFVPARDVVNDPLIAMPTNKGIPVHHFQSMYPPLFVPKSHNQALIKANMSRLT